MADDATLARPYASATFNYAKETGQLDQWSQMLGFLAQVMDDANMKALIASPRVTSETLERLVMDVAADRLSPQGQNFARLLVRNGRAALAGEIARTFEQLRAQEEERIEVHVTSAYLLIARFRDEIEQAMRRRLGREVTITTEIDRNLIAGVVIRAGDLVIDASARGRLNKLAQTMLA
jgi:F-type H+-transporting ATPase subunit delta